MVMYFCRKCWKEIDQGQEVCYNCGAEPKELDEETFISKLLRALDHPEPETPARAAYVLGKLRTLKAVPALIHVIRQSHDFYFVAAAIEALGEIGDRSAINVIQELLMQKPALPVRSAAEQALKKLQSA